jgi:hypothetical protein
MESGEFAMIRVRVEGILDDPKEPFYDGPRCICVIVGKGGKPVEPTTTLYIKPDHMVGLPEVIESVRKKIEEERKEEKRIANPVADEPDYRFHIQKLEKSNRGIAERVTVCASCENVLHEDVCRPCDCDYKKWKWVVRPFDDGECQKCGRSS